MMYQNVDVDQVRARYGGGYVGAQLESQGRPLGAEAIRQFGLGEGDKRLCWQTWRNVNALCANWVSGKCWKKPA